MRISLEDINNSLKNVFKDSELLYSESIYEEINENFLKLIIPLNKLYTDDEFNVIFTKLIFIIDNNKTHVVKNSFLYLYDINDEYVNIAFEDIGEFEDKLRNIFEKDKFGKDIKILSEFLKHPSISLNNWLKTYDDEIEFSFLNVKYIPTSLTQTKPTFKFELSLTNIGDINLNLTKENDKEYKYQFKFENNIVTVKKNNLNDLLATIGETIKNNI